MLRTSIVALALFALGPPAPAAAQPWADITTEALADTGVIRDKKGVALVDFDGDGDLDVSVVGEGLRHATLIRNDAGTFVQITSGDLLLAGSGSGQTWADYDEDGDLDLFMTLEEEPMRLYRNDGGGAFADVTSGPMLVVSHGHSTSWVDYDRDGDLDVYYANFNTPSVLARNDGGAWVNATHDSLAVMFGDGVAWSDYDLDGDLDVYLARFSSRPNRLLVNDGGTFHEQTPLSLLDYGNGHSCAPADFDNDGDSDIYVCNANGPNRLYRNDGGWAFVDVATPALALGAHSASPCWGDYDNDGDLDLFVSVSSGGASHMFRNDGGTFVDVTAGPLFGTGAHAGTANGDVDGDGDLDLYASSYFGLPNKLYRNDLPPGNHWLEIELTGTLSPRTPIGARVTVVTGALEQTHEILGCTGYRSQGQLAAHFGLGAATQVDAIRIRWPSGAVSETTLVAADQRIAIVESADATAVETARPAPRGPVALPNPSAGPTRIAFTLATAGPWSVRIVDAQGRTVRRLAPHAAAAAGRHEVAWDGRDDAGRPVAEGVYLIALAAGETRAASRVVVLR